MKRLLFSLALALCLGVGGGAARAQEEGFPFPPEAPAADPSPVNPVQMSLEGGKILVVIGSPRHFGYRIGEVIPVTLVISADQDVFINIDSISRGVLQAEGSDFELAGKPLVAQSSRGNKKVYRIHLKLRTWVIKPSVLFNVDFLYATALLPDGKTPFWKTATPDAFVITNSNTASDTAKELLEGDMDNKLSQTPVLALPLKVAGIALVSLLPALLLLRLWRRVRPERFVSRAEKAWRQFDRIFGDSAKAGTLGYVHLEQISETLRQYLGIDSVALDDIAIPLDEFFVMHDNKLEMLTLSVSALTKLNPALYSKVALSNEQKAELIEEIGKIVPRS